MDEKLLEKEIDKVEDVSGSGTSMVSLYISAGSSISSERQRMSQEKSEAQNIKSKKNRKNVEKAIDRVNDVLKNYRETPENGIVLFVGVTEDGPVEYVFDQLPVELEYSDYTCDSKFRTDPLRDMIAPDTTIGLLIIERGGSAIGELRGTSIKVHYDEDSNVQSQHNAGGFSNLRFDRIIEEQKEKYFESVSEKLVNLFVDDDYRPTVDGFAIGGSRISVDNFISEGYLPEPLKDVLVGTYSVDIANAENLEELVDKARDEIDTLSEQEEREFVSRFFESVSSNSDTYATYGSEQVGKALQYNAVDTLLVSDDIPNEDIEKYEESVTQQGGDIQIISSDFSEGEQFANGFGGIGALLRHPIN